MTKAEAVTLLFLSKTDLSNLKSLNEYVQQFNETLTQIQEILKVKENLEK